MLIALLSQCFTLDVERDKIFFVSSFGFGKAEGWEERQNRIFKSIPLGTNFFKPRNTKENLSEQINLYAVTGTTFYRQQPSLGWDYWLLKEAHRKLQPKLVSIFYILPLPIPSSKKDNTLIITCQHDLAATAQFCYTSWIVWYPC